MSRDNINMAGNIIREVKPPRISWMLYAGFRTEVTVKSNLLDNFKRLQQGYKCGVKTQQPISKLRSYFWLKVC
jgi:hypothetical protein